MGLDERPAFFFFFFLGSKDTDSLAFLAATKRCRQDNGKDKGGRRSPE